MLEFDQYLFSLINESMSSSFLDPLMVGWRNEYLWIPLYVFLIGFIIVNYKKKAYWLLFFIVLNFGLTDFISSSIVKPLVERPRPCHPESNMENVRLLIPCGSGFSFTSSHACNHFGLAFFLIFTLGRLRKYLLLPLFIWAFLVAYAQVYVGVHYPLDVISGAFLGVLIALVTSSTYKFSLKKMNIETVESD